MAWQWQCNMVTGPHCLAQSQTNANPDWWWSQNISVSLVFVSILSVISMVSINSIQKLCDITFSRRDRESWLQMKDKRNIGRDVSASMEWSGIVRNCTPLYRIVCNCTPGLQMLAIVNFIIVSFIVRCDRSDGSDRSDRCTKDSTDIINCIEKRL